MILVDGECFLCDSFAKFVAQRDSEGIFMFETQQSNAGQQILKLYDQPSDMKTIILVEVIGKTEQCYVQSTAVIRVLSRLNFPWSWMKCCLVVPTPLRDWVYSFIARMRYKWFGRKDVCELPSEVLRSRRLRRLND